MSLIHTNGAQIFAQSTGNGSPILLICGMASDVSSWTPITPLLEGSNTIISFDNRGAGRTKTDSQNWTIDDMVADVLAVLDHHNIKRAHIVGHSMGGMIALRLAHKFPERVGSLVMMSSLNAPSQKGIMFFEQMVELYGTKMPIEDWFALLFHALFSPPFFNDPAQVQAAGLSAASYPFRQSSENLKAQTSALATIMPIDITKITTPTLSLIGENDSTVLPHRAHASLKALPNITFKTLANAAHSVHWEAPQEVTNEIKDFINARPI